MKKFNADLYKVRAKVVGGEKADKWVKGFVLTVNGEPIIGADKIYPIDGSTICRPTGKTDSFRRAVYEYDVIESVTVAEGKKIVERYLVVWDNDLGGYVLISEGGDKCEFDTVGDRLGAGDTDERLFSAIDHPEGLTGAQREYLK